MSKLVCIATFTDRASADMAKSILDAHGIKASVSFDDVGGARPALGFTSGGAKLFVLDENVGKAKEVLQVESPVSKNSNVSHSTEADITFECEGCGKSITFPSRRRGGVETCPFCREYVDVPE